MGEQSFGIDPQFQRCWVKEIGFVWESGVQVASIMLAAETSFEAFLRQQLVWISLWAITWACFCNRTNALSRFRIVLFERNGMDCRVILISWLRFAEPYIRCRAIRHLEKGRGLLSCAGTGNPYYH